MRQWGVHRCVAPAEQCADRTEQAAVVTDAHISQAVADGRNLDETRINDLELPRPLCVDPAMPVPEAAERMLTGRLEHLPVVHEDRLVGLVDLAAVCRVLLRHAGTG